MATSLVLLFAVTIGTLGAMAHHRDVDIFDARGSCDGLSHPETENRLGTIFLLGAKNIVPVLCDLQTDGGGWTVFQSRRAESELDFNRNWADYVSGFAASDLSQGFWLGLDNLNGLMEKNGPQELRIDLMDQAGNRYFAHYLNFEIGDNSTNYKLKVSNYSGDAGDGLVTHLSFSTTDRDNDEATVNCADVNGGAWWFGDCSQSIISNLNGPWISQSQNGSVVWADLSELVFTEMKTRSHKPK